MGQIPELIPKAAEDVVGRIRVDDALDQHDRRRWSRDPFERAEQPQRPRRILSDGGTVCRYADVARMLDGMRHQSQQCGRHRPRGPG